MDYLTHSIQGYLDFRRQWNQTKDSPTGVEYQSDSADNGKYSTPLFASEMAASVMNHKKNHPNQPGFFYLPLQNVHAPLESPGGKYDAACAGVPNSDRKTFCAMAAIADEAIGNLTALIKEEFAGEDYLVIISGDNGGMPMSAGNNWPLRGHKAELWEGGVRNNAVLWGSMLPEALHGSTYDRGMVHVTDWHATLAALGRAKLPPKAPLDGMNVWDAIVGGQESPRKEFLVNYDPCSGHGTCQTEWAYRQGDLKLSYGVSADTWYPLPTSENATKQVLQSTAVSTPEGGVKWAASTGNPEAASSVKLSPVCTAAVTKACPTGTLLCSECIKKNWATISKSCTIAPEARVSAYMCYGVTAWLFNITADPWEINNLLENETAAAPYLEVVTQMQGKLDAIVKGKDYMPPCNIEGGSCYNTDYQGEATAYAHNAWYPWVNSTTSCENKCDVTGECGTNGEKCSSLVKKFSCAAYYAPGKQYAGWCDKECGYGACQKSARNL